MAAVCVFGIVHSIGAVLWHPFRMLVCCELSFCGSILLRVSQEFYVPTGRLVSINHVRRNGFCSHKLYEKEHLHKMEGVIHE